MINRSATIKKFGYDPDALSRGSGKRVVAICDVCGKVRDVLKYSYRDLCSSCAKKKYFKDHPDASEKHSLRMKKLFEDPNTHEKLSAAKKKYWGNPEARKKQSVVQKKRFKRPEEREKTSAANKRRFKDPEARKKQSESMRKRFNDPKEREKIRVANKKYFEDPQAHEKLSAAKKKYFEDHPEAGDKHRAAMKKLWSNPELHERASAAHQGIDYEQWENYAREKKYCPKFNNACRESNREKYGRRCFICNKTEKANGQKLSVHHVDLNRAQGCKSNWKLVPLCKSCHAKAHNEELIARLGYLIKQ